METSHPLSNVLAALRAHQSPSEELHLPSKPTESHSLVPPPPPFPEASVINFDLLLNNHRSTERSDMLTPRHLPDGFGPLIDERLLFVLSGVESSCGISIHRLEVPNEKLFVIFSDDKNSFGIHVANAREHLAMAITARYQLNPKETVWVERYPADPNLGEHRMKEEFWRIAFDSFNPRTGVFKHARCQCFDSFQALVHESARTA